MEALILAALAAVVYWGLCTARERQRGCLGGRGGTETVQAAGIVVLDCRTGEETGLIRRVLVRQ